MLPARNIAIAQVIGECVGWIFCHSGFCAIAFFLFFGVPITSVVACCSKHKVMYAWWGGVSIVNALLHLGAAIELLAQVDGYPASALLLGVQMLLFVFGLLGAHYGFKVCGAQKNPIHPVVGVHVAAPNVGIHSAVPP